MADRLATRVKSQIQDRKTLLLGPSPATISKINDVYRYVLYVKSMDYRKLVAIKDNLEAMIKNQLTNRENVQFDFDPMNNM